MILERKILLDGGKNELECADCKKRSLLISHGYDYVVIGSYALLVILLLAGPDSKNKFIEGYLDLVKNLTIGYIGYQSHIVMSSSVCVKREDEGLYKLEESKEKSL